MENKIIVGLTGPTGSGKSEVAKIWGYRGAKIVDADLVARQVVEPGMPTLLKLVEAFSPAILNEDGSLNRKAMADIAFSTKENTDLLTKITKPVIVAECRRQAYEYAEQGFPAIIDAPLLFEGGLDIDCTLTVAVLADEETRKKRIIARDGLSEERAEARIKAQKPASFYQNQANYIIMNNDDDKDELQIKAEEMWLCIVKRTN